MNRRYLLSSLIKPTTDYGNKGEIYILGDVTVNHNEADKGNDTYFITDITPSDTGYTKYEFSKTDTAGNVVKNTTTIDFDKLGDLFSAVEHAKEISINVNNIDLISEGGITYFPIDDFLGASFTSGHPLTSYYIGNNSDVVKIAQDTNWIDRDAIAADITLKGLKVYNTGTAFMNYVGKFTYYYNDRIDYLGSYGWTLVNSTLTYTSTYNYHSNNECFLDGDTFTQQYENDETARVFALENAICITSCDTSTDLNQTVSVSLEDITPIYYNGTEWTNLNNVVNSLNYTISPVNNTETGVTSLVVNTTCPMRFNPEYGIYFVTDNGGSIAKIDIALPSENAPWTTEQLSSAKNNLYIILGFKEGSSGSPSWYIIDPTRIESVSKSSARIMSQVYGCQCDVLTLSLNNTIDYTVTPDTFVTCYTYWVKDASIFPNVEEESAQANIEFVSYFISDQFTSLIDPDTRATVWHSGRFHISDFFM